MKLEQQVVSPELAKQIKEAGYPQDSHFWHWFDDNKKYIGITDWLSITELNPGHGPSDVAKYKNYIAAPTVAELGEKLPGLINYKGLKNLYASFYKSVLFECGYFDVDDKSYFESSEDKSEADARAKCWLYLKKEGLL
ncbi:MAG TPA: hypothetical protein VD999_05660 [Vitreimonas sp.]|nr:hypothetical protein [Vitreimonas sp.]